MQTGENVEGKFSEEEKGVFLEGKERGHKHRDFWEGVLRERVEIGEKIDEKDDIRGGGER